MIFLYKEWEKFCGDLQSRGISSVPACEVSESKQFLILKHDVETDVSKAYTIAAIEHKYGHRGSYYVQAYLLDTQKNIELLKAVQAMGHEVSYHYDVLDSAHGNMELATEEFEKNKKLFESHGFNIHTVCQHGNPIVERVGYSSNRDFFRSKATQTRYQGISDIMVNFKEEKNVDYLYYSDAGRQFKLIFDPLFNDITPSDDKNIAYDTLSALLEALTKVNNHIVSIHPHRWCKSAISYRAKHAAFSIIKRCAKIAIHVPLIKRIMSRYYYLAKKI